MKLFDFIYLIKYSKNSWAYLIGEDGRQFHVYFYLNGIFTGSLRPEIITNIVKYTYIPEYNKESLDAKSYVIRKDYYLKKIALKIKDQIYGY